MRPLIGILALLLIAFVSLAFAGPESVSFSRSIEIRAPRDSVYELVRHFGHFNRWSPWSILDPQMKWSLSGRDGELQSAYRWEGNDQVGKGEMKLVALQAGKSLSQEILFYEPWAARTGARFDFEEPEKGTTRVTWTYYQQVPFWQRPIMFFVKLEPSLGKDYETGLMNLKKVCEEQKKEQFDLML